MNLTKAKKENEEFLKELYKANSKELGGFNLFFCWDEFLKGNQQSQYYILYDDGVPKGFVRFGYSKKFGCTYVFDIAVVEEFKGTGIGKAIINKLTKPVVLKCNSDNDKGNGFYEKIGFKKIGKELTKNKKKELNVWKLSK